MNFLDLSFSQFALVCGAYFLGSIPAGYLLSKFFGHGDIRQKGSGNIGATNVLRSANKVLALFTLIFDVLKAYVAVYIGLKFNIELYCGVAVVVGHLFPVWLGFKGGKGVATYLGVLLALSFPLGIQAILAWMAFAFLFHYSSLAAILTGLLIPFTVWIWNYHGALPLCIILSTLVIAKHWQNIGRLIRGQEPKISKQ
ncbi:MAG: glycerol-3-phosphate 1-O-acyltransferase PlsY [Alphaproteobacteria bacterium]